MLVERLRCADFRNLLNTELFPDKEMNVICGENAQGKTNILEAIWLFSGAKSFRSSKDSSFIKFGKEKAKTELDFISLETKNNAVMNFSDKRTAFLNSKQLNNPSKLAGIFTAVCFSPSDLNLITDGPSARRKFLDLSIGQLYPNYIEILRAYSRAVTQRNKIIKDYKYDGSLSVMLDVFEEEIASSGEKIINYRKKYIEIIEKYLPCVYDGLSAGREKIKTVYVAESDGKILKEKLREKRKEDMYTGVTSCGPHRDDIEFKINDINVRNYGSQGQKRSVALALKLSGAEVIKEISGEYPVCLLDDVMSELDIIRQNYILNHIKGWQSFITCCDPSNIERLKEGKIFEIENGGIKI